MADGSAFAPSRPRGIEIRDAHFPGRAQLDSYGNGGFRFAEMSHRGSILCLPSGIYGWSPQAMADLTVEAFEQVFKETGLEFLIVGTGNDLQWLNADARNAFTENGIRVETMSTGAAARTFNVLLAEGRPVGAALLAVN